jgi:shikimate dehydrogenase
MLTGATRLAVWGDPIDHSLSPRLHGAAYRALGLDWEYGRRRVDAAGFAAALADLDATWRGLSLTMPLKRAAFDAAGVRDHRAELSGAVNTLLLAPDGPRGFNTDVGGLARDLRTHGFASVDVVRIVGAGATATSALLAVAELGATAVEVVTRRTNAAGGLIAVGERIGVTVRTAAMDAAEHRRVPLTVATLPGGVTLPAGVADALAAGGGLLYDVVYDPWPTDLARAWERAAAPAVAGRGMLTEQALLQVRIFVHGDPAAPLDHEAAVLAVMREAVSGA